MVLIFIKNNYELVSYRP